MGGAVSRDGWLTTFCENIPFAGYFASAVHAVAGNEEHAKRAAAKSTSSTLTTAGGVTGGLLGGPAGAYAGGALGGVVGNAAGAGVAGRINDRQVRASAPDHSEEGYILGGAFGAVGGAAGAGAGLLATRGAVKVAAGQVAGAAHAQLPKTIIQKG